MTVRVPFVDLKAQYRTLDADVNAAMHRVIENTSFILGPEVGALETEFAHYCEVTYGIGVDNGTSALELTLRALGIGPGDEVITAANTFFATAAAITWAGARPVLADVDPHTLNLTAETVEPHITPATKAIIPVHLCGQMADMDPIMELARSRGLVVVEDACQAHGARYQGRRAGSIGVAGCFSFYPSKNLGAYGDGGMVVTDDESLAGKVRQFRDYGQKVKNEHLFVGHNRRLDTLQAAVLRVKLLYLNTWNGFRQHHARRYDELLADSRVTIPVALPNNQHVYHLYAIQSEYRDALRRWLDSHGIQTGIHYPVPIHLQPAYAHLGHGPGDFPVSERYAARTLSLPMYAELTDDQIEYVADAVKHFEG